MKRKEMTKEEMNAFQYGKAEVIQTILDESKKTKHHTRSTTRGNIKKRNRENERVLEAI